MLRLKLFVVLLSAMLLGDVGLMPCSARNVVPLSADSLFRLIDDRSRTVRLKALCIDEASEGENVARSARLPMLNASLSVGYLGNGYLTDRDFGHGMKVHNPHSNNNFALEAMQMIYSGGAISGGIRMAELNSRMAALDLEQSRTQVRFLMLGWLIDLECLHNRRRVIDENIVLADKVLENMRARYEEGVALQSDITRYELQLENLKLQREKTDEALRTTNYRIANALGFDTQDTEFMPRLENMDGTQPVASADVWQELAVENSTAIKKGMLGIDMSETNRNIIAAERLPKLSLFAFGKFDSPIVTEVPVLNKNFMYWGVGLNLSYNISSLYTSNKKVRKAGIAIKESREALQLSREGVRDGVETAYEAYRTAVTELRTQEKSLELARQNYDIVSDRMDNGMAIVTDMVDASNVRLAAEIGLENARTMLLFSYYRLKYVTETL